jgi:WD40 repeat protein
MKLWRKCNQNDWDCIKTLDTAHQRTVRGVDWNGDGRVFASSSFDATCGIWEWEKKDFSKGG